MLIEVKLSILYCLLAIVWSKASISFWWFWSPFVFFCLKNGMGKLRSA